MRASIALATLCLGLLIALPAAAQNTQPAPALQPASMTTQSQPLICRYSYYNGMLIRRQVCRTQHQWDWARMESRRELENLQMRSLTIDR